MLVLQLVLIMANKVSAFSIIASLAWHFSFGIGLHLHHILEIQEIILLGVLSIVTVELSGELLP